MLTSNCFGLAVGSSVGVETPTVATSAVVAVAKCSVVSGLMLAVVLLVDDDVSWDGELCI